MSTPQISVSKEKKADMGLAWAMVSQLDNGKKVYELILNKVLPEGHQILSRMNNSK